MLIGILKKPILRASLLALLVSQGLNAATLDLRILETTDLHGNMMDYNYYEDQDTQTFGLVRTATLIQKARNEAKNSVLVDNGDLIQGSPMADYAAAKGLKKGDIHPAYKALNSLNYVVGSLGNHEFNYGLDYLKLAIAGAKFPYINANVFDAKSGKPYFRQYLIVDTPVQDREGKEHKLRIGYIGFVPPQITLWDKLQLDGKVVVKDITETAKALVPQMRKEGADIVVAIAHSGVSSTPWKALAENSTWYLTEVPGIDAVAFGHSHAVFPGKDFADLKNADIEKGTINGIPAVMPGRWGDHLGVIDLVLEGETGKWKVTSGRAQARPIFDKKQGKSLAAVDPALVKILQEDHNKTKEFVARPIGEIAEDINSYLALLQDSAPIELVRQAQKKYVEDHIQGDPDLADIPVLSAAAPFKAGGRKNDPNDFVSISKGKVLYRNAAEMYQYANTIAAVKVTGADVQEWLECSAGMYNTIDINNKAPQYLYNWSGFRAYNFDMFSDLSYQIDVTQPARYDTNCQLISQNSHRIKNLTWKGKPIDPKAPFLVAVNNYRAFAGYFPGTGEKSVVIRSPDEVRGILANYLAKVTKEKGVVQPKVYNNWSIAPINAPQPLDIRVETSPSPEAAQFIKQHAKYPMEYVGKDNIGFAVYKVNLQGK